MRKLVKTRELSVGMHIVLELPWHRHPFLKSAFVISSKKDVFRLLKAGIEEVAVEGLLPRDVPPEEVVPHLPEQPEEISSPPSAWKPEQLMYPELQEVLHDSALSPSERAGVVKKSSLLLMERLLESPTVENIHAAKKGIYDVVDLILSEREMVQHLLEIISHDYYTYTHCVNVGILSVSLAKALFGRSDRHNMHELGVAFFLHDLGKVRIDSNFINKSSKLSEEEMQEVKHHPEYGYNILDEAQELTEECKLVVLEHHERDDGSGYPSGLPGDEIHLYARICSIADVYDALTSQRSYKQPLTPFEALKLMKEEMLGHFQPELFEKFVMLFT
ncbi:MAG: Cyclic di-GMP phosphodiesterase response regulator RpfG [Syntrophus sp. PtaU1.Bin208]|nr:MAG: Cyclic di-GMP phosphodiesterase response regulator RpfG [Syntrophus sp. PtaU1.Bin208]